MNRLGEQTRSVIIVGFDGLQPAQVTPERMPNLSAMAADGVLFENHHSVFPTVTRVNLASIHTGCYPGTHGLAANNIVVRELDPTRVLTLNRRDLTEVAAKTGRMLLAPTLGEILGAEGSELIAVGIGGTGGAFMQNPHAETVGGAAVHFKLTMPGGLHDEIISRFGPWPKGPDVETGAVDVSVSAQMGRAVDVLTQYFIEERAPAVSVLWCSQPDGAQHPAGVGSELAERALFEADEQFGRLLDWLDRTGRERQTDVIVLSDHGYSTVSATVDVSQALGEAGFPGPGRPGGVTVASSGGAVLFYLAEQERVVADRLTEWLMGQPWCGTVVTSQAVGPIGGALPAALVGAEGDRAPDLAMSFVWDSEPNAAGYKGHVTSTSKHVADHGSLSRQEVNNVLVARGPSFRRGLSVRAPTSNVDVAPTVLSILGLPGAEGMDGRALHEAFARGPDGPPESTTEVHEAQRRVGSGVYRQEISVATVGATTYADYGRGWRE